MFVKYARWRAGRTRYRVGPGLRLPMRKKENVEERLKLEFARQSGPSL